MSLLTNDERDLINGRPFFRDVVMEQTFDLVTSFYPDQRLFINIKEREIEQMMNCSLTSARKIKREIQKKENKKTWQSIRLSEFCEYFEVDDMLMQLFLVSLKRDVEPPPPLQIIAADSIGKWLRDTYDVKKDLEKGMIIHMPLSRYHELNPLGERMFKRKGFYRCIVRAYEIAQIYECHIDTAREMLRVVRAEKGLPPRAHVSIEKFCKVHHHEEEDFRRSLASIHEDDRNVEEDDD